MPQLIVSCTSMCSPDSSARQRPWQRVFCESLLSQKERRQSSAVLQPRSGTFRLSPRLLGLARHQCQRCWCHRRCRHHRLEVHLHQAQLALQQAAASPLAIQQTGWDPAQSQSPAQEKACCRAAPGDTRWAMRATHLAIIDIAASKSSRGEHYMWAALLLVDTRIAAWRCTKLSSS